jgi:hypothetical protein
MQLIEAGRARNGVLPAEAMPSNPRMSTLFAIADVLRVEPEELLRRQ